MIFLVIIFLDKLSKNKFEIYFYRKFSNYSGMKERSMKLNLKILGINDKQKNKNTVPKFKDEKIEKELTFLQVENLKKIKFFLHLFYISDMLVKLVNRLYPENIEYFITYLSILICYSTLITIKILLVNNVLIKDLLDNIASIIIIFSYGFNTAFSFIKNKLNPFFRLRCCYLFLIVSLVEIIFSYNFNLWVNLIVFVSNITIFLLCIFLNSNQNEFRFQELIFATVFILLIHFYKAKEMASLRDHFIQKFRLKKFYYYSDDIINNLNGFQFTLKNKKILISNDNFISYIDNTFGIANHKLSTPKDFGQLKENQNDFVGIKVKKDCQGIKITIFLISLKFYFLFKFYDIKIKFRSQRI